MKIGDYVRTPRFGNVKVKEVFATLREARSAGYIEPTHYIGDDYHVVGKHIDTNRMTFAAIPK